MGGPFMNVHPREALLASVKSVMAAVFVSLVTGTLAQEVKLDTESYMIPSADRDIQLYIRNKHPAGMTNFSDDKTLQGRRYLGNRSSRLKSDPPGAARTQWRAARCAYLLGRG